MQIKYFKSQGHHDRFMKEMDDLIIPPEYSDYFLKELPWLMRIADCEIQGDYPVTGQILCQGTEDNLEKIRYAVKLFCENHISANASIHNKWSDSYFKDEIFVPNERVHELLGEEGKNLLYSKVRKIQRNRQHLSILIFLLDISSHGLILLLFVDMFAINDIIL